MRFKFEAELIRNKRRKQGLSQDSLAYLVGFNGRAQISNMERGMIGVPAKHLIRLCEHLEIEPNDLIDVMVSSYRNEIVRRCSSYERK